MYNRKFEFEKLSKQKGISSTIFHIIEMFFKKENNNILKIGDSCFKITQIDYCMILFHEDKIIQNFQSKCKWSKTYRGIYYK